MFRRGGMKKIFTPTTTTTPAIAATNAIILKEPHYDILGSEGFVHITTLDFENVERDGEFRCV